MVINILRQDHHVSHHLGQCSSNYLPPCCAMPQNVKDLAESYEDDEENVSIVGFYSNSDMFPW